MKLAADVRERITRACSRECERQGVGADRLQMLVDGYDYCLEHQNRLPTVDDLLTLALTIEPTTGGRFRRTPVVFSDGGSGVTASEVPDTIQRLFANLDGATDAFEFTRAVLVTHPFIDGNGRTAFVLYNWLSGTLLEPRPLPEFTFR